MKTIKITSFLFILIILFTVKNTFAQTLYKAKNSSVPVNTPTEKYLVERPAFNKKNSVKTSLLSPFLTTLTVFYTRYLDKESAFQVGISNMNDFRYDNNKYTINASALTLEYRYLLTGTHDLCTYIQPFVRVIKANSRVAATTSYDYNTGQNIITTAYSENTVSAGLGFVVGSQTVFKNRIVIDVYGGPVYSIQASRNTTAPPNTYPTSFPSSRGSLDDPIVKNYGARGGVCLGFLF